ncbi:MAG: hypothetical protein LBR76_01840 [Oscillospiraceae bacterium]|nr:hypothetical protein [Oscillospiraceae bacterium]
MNIRNKPQQEAPQSTPLSCPYYLNYDDEGGTAYRIRLTGDETVSTLCPKCGKEHTIDFSLFVDIVRDDGIYGSMVHCDECSQRR